MTEPIATTGARLKAERERRGLSAQKAADELHLDGWIIAALEAEDYERIGPSVYAKGHLKRYAAYLGLPAADIVAGYESRTQTPKPPVAQPANVRLPTAAPAVSNLPWPQMVGSIVAVLLVLGVLWWKPWHQRGAAPVTREPTDAALPTPAPSPTPSSALPPSAPRETPPAAAVAAAIAAPAAKPAATPAVKAAAEPDATAGIGRARLRLSFSADSWVDVHDAAGRRAFAGKGRANSVRTIYGSAPMRVYLGFASGVQLEINHRAVAIGPQFLAGNVARFEAGADGVLRRDSRYVAPAVTTPGVTAPGVPTPGAVTAPSEQSRNARPTG